MNYVHVRNIEKYHPGYKDRELQWCKSYFKMLNADPDFELVPNEIDKWRFVAFVMLELQVKAPIPLDPKYLRSKGFNLKERPISLTLKMLQNFLEVVANPLRRVREEKEEEKEEELVGSLLEPKPNFEEIWNLYPKKDGRKSAERAFKATVRTSADMEKIKMALKNYLASDAPRKGFVKNGSTWFNNWHDWVTNPISRPAASVQAQPVACPVPGCNAGPMDQKDFVAHRIACEKRFKDANSRPMDPEVRKMIDNIINPHHAPAPSTEEPAKK